MMIHQSLSPRHVEEERPFVSHISSIFSRALETTSSSCGNAPDAPFPNAGSTATHAQYQGMVEVFLLGEINTSSATFLYLLTVVTSPSTSRVPDFRSPNSHDSTWVSNLTPRPGLTFPVVFSFVSLAKHWLGSVSQPSESSGGLTRVFSWEPHLSVT